MDYSDETWYVGNGGHKYNPRSQSSANAHIICNLFWLANNKNDKYLEFCIGYSDKTWYVGSGGTRTTQVVCHHQMHVFITPFAYLFWLANNKTGKYPEFYMGYPPGSPKRWPTLNILWI